MHRTPIAADDDTCGLLRWGGGIWELEVSVKLPLGSEGIQKNMLLEVVSMCWKWIEMVNIDIIYH